VNSILKVSSFQIFPFLIIVVYLMLFKRIAKIQKEFSTQQKYSFLILLKDFFWKLSKLNN